MTKASEALRSLKEFIDALGTEYEINALTANTDWGKIHYQAQADFAVSLSKIIDARMEKYLTEEQND